MKIYCKSLSNRDIRKELTRRGELNSMWETDYAQYVNDVEEYKEDKEIARTTIKQILCNKLGADASKVRILFDSNDNITVTIQPGALSELDELIPERPALPRKPTFDTEDDKQLNREAITQFYNQHLWFKVNYINRAGGSRSEESMYIQVQSISPTGKQCEVKYMTPWDFEGKRDGLDYWVIVRNKTLTTANIEIITPIVTYTQEEVDDILKGEN